MTLIGSLRKSRILSPGMPSIVPSAAFSKSSPGQNPVSVATLLAPRHRDGIFTGQRYSDASVPQSRNMILHLFIGVLSGCFSRNRTSRYPRSDYDSITPEG